MVTSTRRLPRLFIVLMLAAVLAWPQAATTAPYVAELIGINGQVQTRLGSQSFAAAVLLQRLGVRDAVRTQAASKAKLSFIDQSIAVLGEKTTLEISQYRLREAEGPPQRALKIIAGKARVIVHKFFGWSSAEADYTIDTPTIGVGIRGTDLVVAVQGGTDYVYLFQAGAPLKLRSKSTGEEVDLRPGFYAMSQAGRPIRIAPLSDELKRQLLRELSLAFEVRPLGVAVEPEAPPERLERTQPDIGPSRALPPVYTPPVPSPPAPTGDHHY
jgi:hypothetical protein